MYNQPPLIITTTSRVYNTWEKPKLLEDQATFLADTRVNIFKSGVFNTNEES